MSKKTSASSFSIKSFSSLRKISLEEIAAATTLFAIMNLPRIQKNSDGPLKH